MLLEKLKDKLVRSKKHKFTTCLFKHHCVEGPSESVFLIFYYCLLLSELFSYSVVWGGIVLEAMARALFLNQTTLYTMKTVHSEEYICMNNLSI
jgi:hypothetical protein